MVQAIRQALTVSEDNIIEVHSPLLKAGSAVEVIILLGSEGIKEKGKSFSSLLGRGKGSFASPEEADAFIRGERNKWE